MDNSTEQEFRKVYRKLKCKVDCSSALLNIIPVTQVEFLALVNSNDLIFPAIYKITDIQNGLYVETLTGSTFNHEAQLSFLAPDYTLHGQYHTTDGAVANGSIVTWGGFYWENTSGGAVTPDLPDEVNIDSNGALFTKLSKSVANGYVPVILNVVVASDLSIELVTDNYNNTVNNTILSNFGLTYENTAINNSVGQFNDGWVVSNCDGDTFSIFNNRAISTPIIKRCKLSSGQLIVNNEGVGILDVTYIENSHGIQGQHLHLSYNKNIVIVGNSTVDESELNNLSYQENITITGDGNFMASGYFDSSSFEKNITIVGNNNEFNSREFIYDSGIDNFNIQCDGFLFDNVRLTNGSVLSNFSTTTNGRTISDLVIASKSIDLTGFDRDIIGERIEGGRGWFTVTHDFAATPLNSGDNVYYNLIPTGARLTNCTIIPNSLSGGAGATLRIGLEGDDVSYGLAATVLGSILNTVVNTVSNVATANRSLQLTAGVNNITGGTVTVKVEFII